MVLSCSFSICGSQQDFGYSTTVHTAFGFDILVLLTLLQVKYQNSGNPFQTHVATMLPFILAVIIYAIALVAISQPTPNISYLPILRHVCKIFGAFACDFLLLILVPSFGWFILVLCVSISVRLLCNSRHQILQCFQQIFRSINQSTSPAFSKLCGWFQNGFQSLCQTGSRAFNRSPMPTTN